MPKLAGINYESMVDGRGVRTAIFLSGCSHRCPNCQNPDTWNPNYGKEITDDVLREIANEIKKRDFVRGITLTGGDPLFNPHKTRKLLCELSAYLPLGYFMEHDIWLYTGYTWEQLMEMYKVNDDLASILLGISVVVDGPFIQAQADKRLKYRGSRNQRIIDVRKTLRSEKVVLLK